MVRHLTFNGITRKGSDFIIILMLAREQENSIGRAVSPFLYRYTVFRNVRRYSLLKRAHERDVNSSGIISAYIRAILVALWT